MFKQKHYLALGAVTLVALLIFSLPPRATSRLKLAVGSLFLPLFGLVEHRPATARRPPPTRPAATRIAQGSRAISGAKTSSFAFKRMQAAATARENDQLRALLGWQRQTPWKLKLANVVMRDPANWWRTVQIDLGSRDGVRENLPVLTTDGLVGRVSSVGLHAFAGGFARRPELPRFRARRKSGARHRHHQRRAARWTIRSSN